MKHPDVNTAPFHAPFLAPLAAHLGNILATRRTPWKIPLGDAGALLSPAPELVPFSPVCTLMLRCGESLWRAGLGSMDILRVHPALANVPQGTPLPIELRQAVLELLAEPVIACLGTFLGVPVRLEESLLDGTASHVTGKAHPEPAARLMFELCLPRPGSSGACPASSDVVPSPAQTEAASPALRTAEATTLIPVFIDVPDAENARMLQARLNTLPQQNAFGCGSAWAKTLHSLPVPVSVEAGRMKLRRDELAALALDDILLPDDYPAARGVLRLCFLSGAAETPHGAVLSEIPPCYPSILCSVDSLTATVTGFLDPLLQESFMSTTDTSSQPQNQTAADSQTTARSATSSTPDSLTSDSLQHSGQSIDTGALELVVSFELERRLMSVQDISALSPGYTFAMGSDPLSPVTVRVNGKAVGAGRLVDVQGVLGVQITELGA